MTAPTYNRRVGWLAVAGYKGSMILTSVNAMTADEAYKAVLAEWNSERYEASKIHIIYLTRGRFGVNELDKVRPETIDANTPPAEDGE